MEIQTELRGVVDDLTPLRRLHGHHAGDAAEDDSPSHCFPILQAETLDPAELPHVVGHEGRTMYPSDRGDQQVVWSDQRACFLQPYTDLRVPLRALIIEGQRT